MTKNDLRRALLLNAKVINSFATTQKTIGCDEEMISDTKALAKQSENLAIELMEYDLVAKPGVVQPIVNELEVRRRSKINDKIVKTIKMAKDKIRW